ncbi:MAG TPA: hypothetical protein VEI48_02430, partial [Candidatus Sulfotelmatobacter sp.]|nr:hypothetical protein [Candidatus Sulfotelmatobacter sp.]
AAHATALVMDYTCQPGQHCTVYFDAIVSILIPQDPATDYAYWPPTYRVSGIAGPETLSPWVGSLPATLDTLLRSVGFTGQARGHPALAIAGRARIVGLP